jgi:hypothetical protein
MPLGGSSYLSVIAMPVVKPMMRANLRFYSQITKGIRRWAIAVSVYRCALPVLNQPTRQIRLSVPKHTQDAEQSTLIAS